MDAEPPRGRVAPGARQVVPVLGDEPEPGEADEHDRGQVEPARECDDSGEREGREPDVPLVNPAPEQVDADAEGVAVELEHRHRVAYRPERCADEG